MTTLQSYKNLTSQLTEARIKFHLDTIKKSLKTSKEQILKYISISENAKELKFWKECLAIKSFLINDYMHWSDYQAKQNAK